MTFLKCRLNLDPPRNPGCPHADDRAVAQDSFSLVKRRRDPSMGVIDQARVVGGMSAH